MSADADRAWLSPFPGLQSFSDSDADGALFAGRDAEIDLVVANLRAAGLTIYYGPSGVGKSSLLHAGVVRRIRAQADAARAAGAPAPTVIVHDEWAGDPAAVLARQIAHEAGAQDEAMPLDEAIECWCEKRTGLLLLIFDQFEEYLRLHSEAGTDAFDELFPEFAGRLDLPVHVLLSLRDDALAELDRFEGRIPNLFDNYLRLPPMTTVAARHAIELPVARVNEWRCDAARAEVEIEDGLVDDVLAQLTDPHLWSLQVGGASDRAAVELAFLQIVMKRLWDADSVRQPLVLLRATLAQLGGAAAIVRDHLDSAMASLSREQQATAAAAFGYLVTPSGAKIRYTAEDLADYAQRSPTAVHDVLEALARPQLRIIRRVPAPSGDPDREGYEIFHDVLAGAVRDWSQRIRTARLERRTARLTVALAAIVAMAVASIAWAIRLEPLEKLELSTVDLRFAVRGAASPDPNIVLVGLPKTRITRDVHARLLDKIFAADPAWIVDDIEFMQSYDLRQTQALRRAVRRTHTRLVLATTRFNLEGKTTLYGLDHPRKKFDAADVAYGGFPTDPDGAVRMIEYEVRQHLTRGESSKGGVPVPTLAAYVTQKTGGRVDKADFPGRGAWIDFAGGPGTYRPIPFADVLNGTASAQTLRDRIIVIGQTDRDTDDRLKTSAGAGAMPGAEVHANAIATFRVGVPLRDLAWPVGAASIVLLALLESAFALRTSTGRALLLSAAVGLVVLGVAQVAFDEGRVATVVYPLLALVVCAAANAMAAGATSSAGALRRRQTRRRGTAKTSESAGINRYRDGDGRGLHLNPPFR